MEGMAEVADLYRTKYELKDFYLMHELLLVKNENEKRAMDAAPTGAEA